MRGMIRPPTLYQISGGKRPLGKVELKTFMQESLRNNAAALENKLSFRA